MPGVPRSARWGVLVLVLLLVVLVPFGVFGQALEGWTEAFINTTQHQPIFTGLVLGLLLVSDILLPVPSSIVSTAAGYVLGFFGGLLTSFLGMSVGSLIGYWLGYSAGRGTARWIVGKSDLDRFAELSARWGDWGIIIARPIPVLAEISAFAAGIGGMNLRKYLLLSSLANVGISAVYAATGAFAASFDTFLLAFAGAVLVPGMGMLFIKKVMGRKK